MFRILNSDAAHKALALFQQLAETLVLLLNKVRVCGALAQRRHLAVDLLAAQREGVRLGQHLLEHCTLVAGDLTIPGQEVWTLSNAVICCNHMN